MTTSLSNLALTLSGTLVSSVLTKTVIIAILGLAAAAALRHGRASVRHLVLAWTFAAMVLIPVATAALPSVIVEVPVATTVSQPVSARAINPAVPAQTPTPAPVGAAAPQQPTLAISATTLIASAWAVGAALFSVGLVSGLWKLRHLRRSALPWLEERSLIDNLAREAGIARQVDLVVHEEAAAPITCGLITPVIIFPTDARNWDVAALQRALVHELEHVRRHDWWVHLAARAICALYWFNPLTWMAYRQLSLDAERACDDAVVRNEESTQYAEQLVNLARRLAAQPSHPALAMAARSDLAKRVSALLDSHQARGRAGIAPIAAITAVAAALMLAVAPVRVVGAVTGGAEIRDGQQRNRRVAAGDRALIEAADEGDVEGLKWLLDAGAQVNARVDGDGSPLIVAAREGHIAAVQFLLDRGADPNLGVEGDGNPLIMAAREGHLRIVELLLSRGAAVNEAVDGDENALIQASENGRLDVVRLLVSRGADVNARIWADRAYERPQGEWRTPLSQARKGGHRAVVEFLISVGAQ